ncbi:hypothetical protein N658DRAFT_68991 [Parathielavia hyrcaniae]|uniref:Uncharacterized protein n=1 Tax=Parathielavia hyrcaniae TaxID=113614 RepID=A0AAN6T237_9PEZI|nr:hypothetical protein N658DRAFT_68991 [Parathielavia hyrcaniae]
MARARRTFLQSRFPFLRRSTRSTYKKNLIGPSLSPQQGLPIDMSLRSQPRPRRRVAPRFGSGRGGPGRINFNVNSCAALGCSIKSSRTSSLLTPSANVRVEGMDTGTNFPDIGGRKVNQSIRTPALSPSFLLYHPFVTSIPINFPLCPNPQAGRAWRDAPSPGPSGAQMQLQIRARPSSSVPGPPRALAAILGVNVSERFPPVDLRVGSSTESTHWVGRIRLCLTLSTRRIWKESQTSPKPSPATSELDPPI